jgi:catechol 2,3-dioxygenase-like lactoylglutathione lyase family enzyme
MGAVTIPILPTTDFDATAAFYASLGFEERRRWPGDYLIIVGPAGTELHFWMAPDIDPASNRHACYIRFDDGAEAAALHDAWAACELAGGRLHPVNATDYGMLEFALVDPHGNLLRIGGRQAPPAGGVS